MGKRQTKFAKNTTPIMKGVIFMEHYIKLKRDSAYCTLGLFSFIFQREKHFKNIFAKFTSPIMRK